MSVAKIIASVVGGFAVTLVLSGSGPTHRPDDTLPLVVDFELDGRIGEWNDLPVRYGADELGERGKDLRVWVGQVEGGIAVAGEGSAARFDPATGPGIGFWLADGDPPRYPPIGWGHQFGYEELASAADCAEYEEAWEDGSCPDWYDDQLEHRTRLTRLFVRRWQANARHVRETSAGPAWAAFDALTRDRLRSLEPRGEPVFSQHVQDGKTAFELFVPWVAFPPLTPLTIDRLRIGVDLPPSLLFESPALETVVLAQSREYRVTRCELGDRAAIIRPHPTSAFRVPSALRGVVFLPVDDRDLLELVILDNEAGGYLYTPDSTIASPVAFRADFYVRNLEDGSTLCGPVLAYRSETVQTQPRLERLVWAGSSVADGDPVFAEQPLETRRLPDGNLLVKEGPWIWMSYYGSGQCGGCPRVSVGIHHVDTATGELTAALSHSVVAEYFDTEISVSADWTEVTAYESQRDYEQDVETVTWTATTYCYQPEERRFEVCGVESPVPAPPRALWLDWEEVWE
jgi:hypothetical protein